MHSQHHHFDSLRCRLHSARAWCLFGLIIWAEMCQASSVPPASQSVGGSAQATQLAAVVVRAATGSVQASYRNLSKGNREFVKHHDLAPDARLQFHVADTAGTDSASALQMRLEGEDAERMVVLDPQGNFSLPSTASSQLANSHLLANRPADSVQIHPLVRVPTEGRIHATLGDLRLECRVTWAITKKSASFFVRSLFALSGGVCNSSRIQVNLYSPEPLAAVQLHAPSGDRSLKIGKDRHWYTVPVSDKSLHNRVTLTFIPIHANPVCQDSCPDHTHR